MVSLGKLINVMLLVSAQFVLQDTEHWKRFLHVHIQGPTFQIKSARVTLLSSSSLNFMSIGFKVWLRAVLRLRT